MSIPGILSASNTAADQRWLCPVVLSNKLLGQYCVVIYNGHPFPGIIRKCDQEAAQVECLLKAGKNRWYFNEKIKDTCWYTHDKIIGLIPAHTDIGSRHKQVDNNLWDKVVCMICDRYKHTGILRI